ncbi:MAG: hypothetical protein ACR2LI_15965 [Propionibacteriaceae bacterium]
MEDAIAWSGFVGAWLLVAGPIHQAAVELEEENVSRERIQELRGTVPAPTEVSAWWWLLPPVAYLLNRRRNRAFRRSVFEALDHETVEQLVRFSNKATGWLFVASGAFFIAIKETWELGEHYAWPIPIFVGLVLIMVLLSAVNTVVRMRRSHAMTGEERPGSAARLRIDHQNRADR